MPRKDAILQGERDRSIALGALEGRFWLPGSSVCIGSRAPAQGTRPSAMKVLAACAMANFHCDGRCLPPPQTPMGRDRPVRAARAEGPG